MSKPTNRMKTRVDSIKALAAAIAVYRENGNRVEKYSATATGNKEMALALLDSGNISDSDIETAKEIRAYMGQKLTIAELTGGRVSDFFRDISNIINEEQVAYFSVGLIVWAPKVVDDAKKRDDIKEDINQFYFTSKYIGQVKDKVELNFTPIDVRYLTIFNCYRHVGHDNNGNLITFLNKNSINTPSRIKARVKGCDINRFYNNAKATNLNFVKVI